jgi:hypothetical protein
MEEARRDYSEALQICYSLAIRNPNIFWRDLADVAAKLVFVLVVEHLRLILVIIGSLMIVLAFWLRARRKRHKGE